MRLIYQCLLCGARREAIAVVPEDVTFADVLEACYAGANAKSFYQNPKTLHPCNAEQTGVAHLIGVRND